MVCFGKMDRRVRLESRAETIDAMGAVLHSWSLEATVWAERRNLRGGERFGGSERLASAETVFRIRYSRDVWEVGPMWRLVDGAEVFDIVGAVAVHGGRPDRLEIFARRAVNPEREAAP